MFQDRERSLSWLLALVMISVPAVTWCTSGEVLLRELRQQVDAQRHNLSEKDLREAGDLLGRNPNDPGNIVECTPEAIAAFRANGSKELPVNTGEYIYNATYTPFNLPVGNKYCVYLTRPVNRGLTVDEARDLNVAYHLEFPRYDPPEADRRVAEDQFLSLRAKARAKRASMTQDQRDAIETQIDHIVECSDQELTDIGTWREIEGGSGINEDIDSINYVWNWSNSVDADACVYVRSPLHRALTIDEARDLFTLTHEPLPSMQRALSISPAGAKRRGWTQGQE